MCVCISCIDRHVCVCVCVYVCVRERVPCAPRKGCLVAMCVVYVRCVGVCDVWVHTTASMSCCACRWDVAGL